MSFLQTYIEQIEDILLRQPTVSLISFDIFDTLITRTVKKPEDIFKILEKSLIDKKLISNKTAFFDMRIACHKEAYMLLSDKSEEITLDLVYDLIADKPGIDKNLIEIIKKMELDLEKKMLIPIPETLEILAFLRAENKQIVFTSDMYLPAEFLTDLLRDLQIYQTGDTLYLSSEVGKRKSSGQLFHFLLNKEKIQPEQLLHIGDNQKSDVTVPKNMGITVMHYTRKDIKRPSSLLQIQTAKQHDLYDNFIHQCSTIAYNNLTSKSNKKIDHDLVEFATFVAAPLLFFYTLWILETAKKNNIKNLYFLSRDGQILYYIAKIIIEKREDYNMNCHYLYASRQLWHLPSIESSIGDSELEWILQNAINNDFNSILKKVDLKYSSIEKYAKQFGLEQDTKIVLVQIKAIRQFFHEPDIIKMVTQKAQEKREALLKYFEQEGLLNTNDIAIVDLGWHGNLQKSLRKILDIAYKNNSYLIYGFYLKLLEDKTSPKDKSYIFLTKQTKLNMVPIIEFLASADHNSAVGIQMKNNFAKPLFAEIPLNHLIAWGIKDWHKSILECSTILSESDFTYKHIDTLGDISIDIFYTFYDKPKKNYLKILSRYPFSYDQSGEKIGQIVKKQDFNYLLSILKIKKNYKQSIWADAGFYISNPFYKLLFYPLHLLKKYR